MFLLFFGLEKNANKFLVRFRWLGVSGSVAGFGSGFRSAVGFGLHPEKNSVKNRINSFYTEFYRVLPGLTGFYLVLLGFTGFYWVLLGFTSFYLVLLGLTGFDWV